MRRAFLLFVLGCLVDCGFGGRVIANNLAQAGDSRRVLNKVTNPYRPNSRLSALWVGHATVLLQLDDQFMMTDPVFTHAVGELSPRLVEPGLDAQNVPPLAAVVISHMHFDHLSFGSLELIEDKIPLLLLPPGARSSVPRYAFESRELEPWESVVSHGVRITAVPVSHVGGRYGVDQAFHPRSFLGWVFEYHGLSVYFGGDTSYNEANFRAARARFGRFDLALLPICPIAPRDFMERTHMDPEQALHAFLDLGADHMMPIHFDTFINSDDAPGQCASTLRSTMPKLGLDDTKVSILEIGEQHVFVSK